MSYSLPPTARIDAHAHVFDKSVLSWRLLLELLSCQAFAKEKRREKKNRSESLRDLSRILHFLSVGLTTTPRICRELLLSEPCEACAALMFDLEYCMKGARGDLRRSRALKKNARRQVREFLRESGRRFLVASETANEAQTAREYREAGQRMRSLAGRVSRMRLGARDTFREQENALVQLEREREGSVFPFFAVDPRRPGLFERRAGEGFLLTPLLARLKRNGGAFYGFKLYCPNGYSPTDSALTALYEYCEREGVPITAHCALGGFASFASSVRIEGDIFRDGSAVPFKGVLPFRHHALNDPERVAEKAVLLNHPRLWEKVLRRFPKLKLNMAHFGTQPEGTEWRDLIFEMMHTYPELRTDFSCVTEASELARMRDLYRTAGEQVRSRFLYGSDFYLNLLFTDSMATYVRNFESLFTEDERSLMTVVAPRSFLGLD